jgi:hypothetical protein
MKFLATVVGGRSHFGTARPGPDRAGLIAAKAAAAGALQVVADRRETLERLQSVDDHANQLARAAADATLAASQARARWVDDGCLEHARGHHAATEAATKAAGAAQMAALDATAARKAMPAAEAAVRSAESDLKRCADEIDNHIGLIQLEEFNSTLEEFRRVTDRRHALHLEIRGFLEGASSGAAARHVRQVLEDCSVQTIPDFASTAQGTLVSRPPESVLERGRQWRKEAEALRGGT